MQSISKCISELEIKDPVIFPVILQVTYNDFCPSIRKFDDPFQKYGHKMTNDQLYACVIIESKNQILFSIL